MKSTIFILTHKKDYPYLTWCLRSVEKFATGFHEVRVLTPEEDLADLKNLVSELNGTSGIPIHCLSGIQWPSKGMLWHDMQKVKADKWCPEADLVFHIDSDCVFSEPVTPEDYLVDGRPILRFEPFARIGDRVPGVMRWKTCTEACLPFPIDNETMRCHPGVYTRDVYNMTRELAEHKLKMPLEDYLLSRPNDDAGWFCEFNALGNVAMQCLASKYELVEQFSDLVTPDNKLVQFWSHGSIKAPQDIWLHGKVQRIVPIDKIRELGIA